MTTGTLLAFIVTGIIVLVAIVGGIWLETRLPVRTTSAAAHLVF
jgi:hypothetical protein